MGVNKININNNDSNYAHSIFDISEYTGKTYDTMSDALADVPDGKKKGGMTVSFVSTSDNKYIQARCMAQNFTTDVTQWQGVDDEPTAGSDNLVKSGGVADVIANFRDEKPADTIQTLSFVYAQSWEEEIIGVQIPYYMRLVEIPANSLIKITKVGQPEAGTLIVGHISKDEFKVGGIYSDVLIKGNTTNGTYTFIQEQKGYICVLYTENTEYVSIEIGSGFDGINADIKKLEEKEKDIEQSISEINKIEINIPTKIYAVKNDTLQLYYESIFGVPNFDSYDINVVCNIGHQYPRYYEVTPTNKGEYTITFIIRDQNGIILSQKESKIVVCDIDDSLHLTIENKFKTTGSKQLLQNPLQTGDVVVSLDGLGSLGLWYDENNYDLVTTSTFTCLHNYTYISAFTQDASYKTITSKRPYNALNVLCVGSSLTSGGQWASVLKGRLNTQGLSDFNFVGRQNLGTIKIEATGGYSFDSYTNASFPKLYKFYFTEEHPITQVSLGCVYLSNGNQFTITEINLTQGIGYISCTKNGSNPDADVHVGGTMTKVSGTGDDTLTYSRFDFEGNPFVYNGVIDIEQYAEDYCGGKIDVVVMSELLLSDLTNANAMPMYADNMNITLNRMQTFMNMFTAVFPKCIFLIATMPLPDKRGGLGVNYGASGTRVYGGIKHNAFMATRELLKYIETNGLGNKLFLMNWSNDMDNINDYDQIEKDVNVRSSVKEIFGTNGFHPEWIGYQQFGDSAFRSFINIFAKK